jgi:hypothetical protein
MIERNLSTSSARALPAAPLERPFGLQRVRLGAFEQYGEVLSGTFIALVGLVFWSGRSFNFRSVDIVGVQEVSGT